MKNPVDQHLVIQSDSVDSRQLMDTSNGCLSGFKAYGQVPTAITVDEKDHMINNIAGLGGFKEWKVLPAGDYKIKATKAETGKVDYTMNINVHTEKEAVSFGKATLA